MSYWHWIIDDPKLTANEKLVMLTIRRHQFKGHTVNPSQARIAALSGLSLRTVNRCISAVQRKGYSLVNTPGKGRHRTNFYDIEQRQGLLFSGANDLGKIRHTGVLSAENTPVWRTEVSNYSVSTKKERAGARDSPAGFTKQFFGKKPGQVLAALRAGLGPQIDHGPTVECVRCGARVPEGSLAAHMETDAMCELAALELQKLEARKVERKCYARAASKAN